MTWEHYRHEDTINGIHIFYGYDLWDSDPNSRELTLRYRGLEIQICQNLSKYSQNNDPEVLDFNAHYTKEALHILSTIDVIAELDKCTKSQLYRFCVDGREDDENFSCFYTKEPKYDYDLVGLEYYITIEYREYDDEYKCIKEQSMLVVFDKDGKILETRTPYETKIDVQREIDKFLLLCREKKH